MVATPNLFFKLVFFFDSSSRRDSGCDKGLWYSVEHMLHPLSDDNGAINTEGEDWG